MRVLIIILLLFLLCVVLARFVFIEPQQSLYKKTATFFAIVLAFMFVYISVLGLLHGL